MQWMRRSTTDYRASLSFRLFGLVCFGLLCVAGWLVCWFVRSFVCLFIYLFLISLLFVGSLRALSIWFVSFFYWLHDYLFADCGGEILRFHAARDLSLQILVVVLFSLLPSTTEYNGVKLQHVLRAMCERESFKWWPPSIFGIRYRCNGNIAGLSTKIPRKCLHTILCCVCVYFIYQ